MTLYALILPVVATYALTRFKHWRHNVRVASEHKAAVVQLQEEHAKAMHRATVEAWRGGRLSQARRDRGRIERARDVAFERGVNAALDDVESDVRQAEYGMLAERLRAAAAKGGSRWN